MAGAATVSSIATLSIYSSVEKTKPTRLDNLYIVTNKVAPTFTLTYPEQLATSKKNEIREQFMNGS
jgi:hypothetical protein